MYRLGILVVLFIVLRLSGSWWESISRWLESNPATKGWAALLQLVFLVLPPAVILFSFSKRNPVPSRWKRFLERAWKWFGPFWLCRIPVLFSIVTVGGVFLLVPAATDALFAFTHPLSAIRWYPLRFSFYLFAAGLGFYAWYFSRATLNAVWGADRNRIVILAPRIIGGVSIGQLACLLLWVQYQMKAGFNSTPCIATAILGVFMVCLWVIRRPAMEIIEKRGGVFRSVLKVLPDPPKEVTSGGYAAGRIAAMILLPFVGMLLLLIIFPIGFPEALGSAAILLSTLSLFTGLGSYLAFLNSKYQLPAFSILLVVATVYGWDGTLGFGNDNHRIRTLSAKNGPQSGHERPNLALQFKTWATRVLERDTGSGPIPVYIVTASGGGSRAGYWAGAVLARLQDRSEEFGSHVFAISSVSGGTLGALEYLTLLSSSRNRPPGDPLPALAQGWAMANRRFVGHDFLSPLLGSWFYPNLIQGVLPLPVRQFDRGSTLEMAFETAWRNMASPGPERARQDTSFQIPFSELWNPSRSGSELEPFPSIFINGTWVEEGKRIITSNVAIEGKFFADAVDGISKIGEPFRISTGVMLSARFPYFGPAGTIKNPDGSNWGHIVDGGYFENSGCATGWEILLHIKSFLMRFPAPPAKADTGIDPEFARLRPWRLKPIVIMITNDVDYDVLAESDPHRPDKASKFLNETLTPPRTLLAARDARAVYSMKRLRAEILDKSTVDLGEAVSHFENPPDTPISLDLKRADTVFVNAALSKYDVTPNGIDSVLLPVSWSLSDTVCGHMDRKADLLVDSLIKMPAFTLLPKLRTHI